VRVFFVALIPAIVLAWILYIATGVLLTKVCLENWRMVTGAINALPFSLPPALFSTRNTATTARYLVPPIRRAVEPHRL